jgi:hypothetical protein
MNLSFQDVMLAAIAVALFLIFCFGTNAVG